MKKKTKENDFLLDINFDDEGDVVKLSSDSALMKGNKGKSELDSLLEASFQVNQKKLKSGDKVKCELLAVSGEEAFFSIKSPTNGRPYDGVLALKEIKLESGELSVRRGEVIDLFIVSTKGQVISLSKNPLAKSIAEDLEDAYRQAIPIEGKVVEVCQGGVRVQIRQKVAFCPLSQLDLSFIENGEAFIGQKFDFLIVTYSEGGRNIVVSRRVLLQKMKGESEKSFLKEKSVGDVVSGKVKRMESYGAFVELIPGLEGLIHISEISWARVNSPQEVLKLGQDVVVKVLKMEKIDNKVKISLSLKQVGDEPWTTVLEKFKEGDIVQGRVLKIIKFGAIVEIATGIDGLIPLSEMSFTKRVTRADEMMKEGEKIVVKIKEINITTKKLLLSLKDAGSDPWALIHQKYPILSLVKGRITRKEQYGVFMELEEGVVGLLPKSQVIDSPDLNYDKIKVDDVVTLQVQEVDQEGRRISLTAPKDPEQDEWKKHIETKVETFSNKFAAKFSRKN